MSSIVISGDTSGAVTVTVPAVSGTNTVTIPATTGTVMVSSNMPAFSAYQTSDQTMTSGDTAYLCQIGSEVFDTASCFNNTGSTVGSIPTYAFLPNVAGYYQVNAKSYIYRASGNTYSFVNLYKNGSQVGVGSYLFNVNAIDSHTTLSYLVYLNGTTDYIQMYCQAGGASSVIRGGATFTYFQASMVRSA